MIGVEINPVRGVNEKTLRELERLRKKIKHPSEANKNVAVRLERWVHENFDTEGGKVGGWAPYKYGGRVVTKKSGKANARSVEGRKYVDASAQLLYDSGNLRGKFIPFWDDTNAGIGTLVPYSVYHETGTKFLPRRQLIPDSDDPEITTLFIRIYEDFIVHAAEDTGFEVTK